MLTANFDRITSVNFVSPSFNNAPARIEINKELTIETNKHQLLNMADTIKRLIEPTYTNESVINTLEDLMLNAKDSSTKHFLKFVLEEACQEFDFCKDCFEPLKDKIVNMETVYYCPECEKVKYKLSI